jgi:hypothetical protein
MTLGDAQRAFTRHLATLLTWARDHDYAVTVGDAYRSAEEAARLTALGVGVLESPHRRRLAIDLNLFLEGVYQTSTDAYLPLGVVWEALGPECRWGGRFTRADGNHFEVRWPPPPASTLSPIPVAVGGVPLC